MTKCIECGKEANTFHFPRNSEIATARCDKHGEEHLRQIIKPRVK
jgi:hypothetical protein